MDWFEVAPARWTDEPVGTLTGEPAAEVEWLVSAASWSTYLPPGEWTGAWTGDALTGGRTVTRPAPIDEIPVYCRRPRPNLASVFTE